MRKKFRNRNNEIAQLIMHLERNPDSKSSKIVFGKYLANLVNIDSSAYGAGSFYPLRHDWQENNK